MTIEQLLRVCGMGRIGKMPAVKTKEPVRNATSNIGRVVVIKDNSTFSGCAVSFPGLNYDTWFDAGLGTDKRSHYMTELTFSDYDPPECQAAEPITAEKAIALTSPALTFQEQGPGRHSYPANFRGRVPLRVRVAETIEPDLPEFKQILDIPDGTICIKDQEYYVYVNSLGAVSAILPNGQKMGLLPSEFDVTEWHINQKIEE